MLKMLSAGVFGAILMVSGAAHAQSADGFRIEAHAGYDDIPTYGAPETNRKGGDGLLLGGGIGYDFDLGGVVVGPEVNLDFTTARARFAGPPAQVLSESKGGRDIELALRAGLYAGDTTLLYIKAGYDNARFKSVTSIGTFRGNSEGLRLGAGVQQRLAGQSYVKLEYRYTNYGRVLSFNDFNARHQAVAGVGIRF